MLPDPLPELRNNGRVVSQTDHVQEARQRRRADSWKGETLRLDAITLSLEDMKRKPRSTHAPDLRDSKGRIDRHAIQRAAGDVHLDSQVRRRIRAQIKMPFTLK